MTAAIKQELEIMQGEFESHRLTTILAPSKRHDRNESDMIRVNLDENCPWYRELCAKHLRNRKRLNPRPDTVIDRKRISSTLDKLVNGRRLYRSNKYAEDILQIAEKRLKRKGRAA